MLMFFMAEGQQTMTIDEMRKIGIGAEKNKKKPKLVRQKQHRTFVAGDIYVDGKLVMAGDSDISENHQGKSVVTLPRELAYLTRGQRSEHPEERVKDFEFDAVEKKWFVWKPARNGGYYKKYR